MNHKKIIFWLIIEPLLALFSLIDLGLFSIHLSFTLCLFTILCWITVFSMYQKAGGQSASNRSSTDYNLVLIPSTFNIIEPQVSTVQNDVPDNMNDNSKVSVQPSRVTLKSSNLSTPVYYY